MHSKGQSVSTTLPPIQQDNSVISNLNVSSLLQNLDQSKLSNTTQYRKVKMYEVKNDLQNFTSPMKKLNTSQSTLTTMNSTVTHNNQRQQKFFCTRSQYTDPMNEEKDSKNEQKLIKQLQESFEIDTEDSKQRDLIVGDNAVAKYYHHYKKLNKIVQQNKYFSIADSPHTSMLTQSEVHLVTPCKVGLIKRNGEEDSIEIKNMHFGDRYMDVLNEGLKKLPNVNEYYLSDNRVSQKSSANLLKTISWKAKVLEINANCIGKIGCENIAKSIEIKDCKLEILNLEDNKLGTASSKIIIDACLKSKTMRILNLSKNFISDSIQDSLKQLIDENTSLREIYLHWNQLRASSGRIIFATLTTNETLKVFDISNNSLGMNGSCAKEISEFLEKNQDIVHLDLSSNCFSYEDCQTIATSLEKNKTIYGFHFSGNFGYVDSRGFIVLEKQPSDLTGIVSKRRIQGQFMLKSGFYKSNRDLDLRDCCWICDGWREETFIWDPVKSGQQPKDPTFIHFNFENFRANYYGKLEPGQQYIYKRMVPPGNLYYFYEIDDQFYAADDQPKKIFPEGQEIEQVPIYDDTTKPVILDKVNLKEIHKEDILRRYLPLVGMLPRVRDPVYIPPKKKRKVVRWTFPISLMYRWRPDDEDLLNKCFDFDWENGKMKDPRMIKKEEEIPAVKEFFRSKYKYFKDTYKYYASLSPVGDIWAIQNVSIQDFIAKINIIDGKLIQDADITIKLVSTLGSALKGNPRSPPQGIIRQQFMELIFRLADFKYIQQYKTATTYADALQKFWDEHLQKEMLSRDEQTWRKERYWNEQCDYCLKNYKRIVEHVYKKFSKKKVKPGQQPFMSMDELQSIVSQMCLEQENDKIGTSSHLFAFNLSMMTQIDEINNERIFQMSQLEFYEALARIAEVASLKPITGIYPEDQEITYEFRKNMLLGYKLEALLVRMLNYVCDASFKEQYPKIERSFFWVDPDASDFEYVDRL